MATKSAATSSRSAGSDSVDQDSPPEHQVPPQRTGLRNLTHRLYVGDISYDFIGHRRRWYLMSGVLLVLSIAALGIFRLDLGIEFKGGADFQVNVASVSDTTADAYRDVIRGTGLPDLDGSTVTTTTAAGGTGGSDRVRVQTRGLTVDEVAVIRGAIAQQAGVPAEQVTYSLIDASWGSQISQRALIALAVFLALVSLVIWATFRDPKMAVAGLVALAHDVIITIGVYALVGFTVTPATVIGVLTILGYSLYDTVVVFDKVRENVRGILSSTTKTYSEAANSAINQVLVRSLNTTVIGVLPVAALLFAGAAILGEGPLKDLALALFVGMIAGAYSSIFIATPLLAQLREQEPAMRKQRRRVENRRAKLAGRSEPHRIEADPVAAPAAKKASGTWDSDELAAAEAEVAKMSDTDGGAGAADTGAGAGDRRSTVGVDVIPAGGAPRLRTLGLTADPADPADPVDKAERSKDRPTTPRRRNPTQKRKK